MDIARRRLDGPWYGRRIFVLFEGLVAFELPPPTPALVAFMAFVALVVLMALVNVIGHVGLSRLSGVRL